MSEVKDIIMETVRRMPENVTFMEAASDVLDVGKIYEDLKASEEEPITIDELLMRLEEISSGKIQETPERIRILKMAIEAKKSLLEGDVKKSSDIEEFWKDLND